MNVSLTPELETWIQSRVETGMYGSSSEVVREALRIYRTYETGRDAKLSQCDPATILAAVTPIPDSLAEYAFAGLLRGSKTEVTRS